MIGDNKRPGQWTASDGDPIAASAATMQKFEAGANSCEPEVINAWRALDRKLPPLSPSDQGSVAHNRDIFTHPAGGFQLAQYSEMNFQFAAWRAGPSEDAVGDEIIFGLRTGDASGYQVGGQVSLMRIVMPTRDSQDDPSRADCPMAIINTGSGVGDDGLLGLELLTSQADGNSPWLHRSLQPGDSDELLSRARLTKADVVMSVNRWANADNLDQVVSATAEVARIFALEDILLGNDDAIRRSGRLASFPSELGQLASLPSPFETGLVNMASDLEVGTRQTLGYTGAAGVKRDDETIDYSETARYELAVDPTLDDSSGLVVIQSQPYRTTLEQTEKVITPLLPLNIRDKHWRMRVNGEPRTNLYDALTRSSDIDGQVVAPLLPRRLVEGGVTKLLRKNEVDFNDTVAKYELKVDKPWDHGWQEKLSAIVHAVVARYNTESVDSGSQLIHRFNDIICKAAGSLAKQQLILDLGFLAVRPHRHPSGHLTALFENTNNIRGVIQAPGDYDLFRNTTNPEGLVVIGARRAFHHSYSVRSCGAVLVESAFDGAGKSVSSTGCVAVRCASAFSSDQHERAGLDLAADYINRRSGNQAIECARAFVGGQLGVVDADAADSNTITAGTTFTRNGGYLRLGLSQTSRELVVWNRRGDATTGNFGDRKLNRDPLLSFAEPSEEMRDYLQSITAQGLKPGMLSDAV